MVSQYIRNENVNQIAHEQVRVCSTRKWAKLEHKSCLVMSSNLGRSEEHTSELHKIGRVW